MHAEKPLTNANQKLQDFHWGTILLSFTVKYTFIHWFSHGLGQTMSYIKKKKIKPMKITNIYTVYVHHRLHLAHICVLQFLHHLIPLWSLCFIMDEDGDCECKAILGWECNRRGREASGSCPRTLYCLSGLRYKAGCHLNGWFSWLTQLMLYTWPALALLILKIKKKNLDVLGWSI